jgi:hypothetical protein
MDLNNLKGKRRELVFQWCVYHKLPSWDRVRTLINVALARGVLKESAVEKSFRKWAKSLLKDVDKSDF